ncbi:MAG: flagellar basal body P-ring protein FlgI [Pirellula sp.]|jgi:flagellar P-ring protein precursor FlgI
MLVDSRKLCQYFCLIAFTLGCLGVEQARADLRIGDICRYQGQEENTIHGVGLVVGLKGTGDGDFKSTNRSLGQVLLKLGGNPSVDMQGRLVEKDIANTKNVAMVLVQATIPAQGVIQGDRLDCSISAISAKSLEGGNLVQTLLLGPRGDVVYGIANGPIMLDNPKVPTTARIANGCKMEQSVKNPFVQDNRVTLVLHKSHSAFETAQIIADRINHFDDPDEGTGTGNAIDYRNKKQRAIATAIDQTHIVVTIPEEYRDTPVQFVSQIERIPLVNIANKKRVYINERNDVIVIGEDVTIAPVAVSYGSLTIAPQTARGGPAGSFVAVSPKDDPTQPKLKNLVDALNVLSVPTKDIVAIIKGIHKQGNMYGELIIE